MAESTLPAASVVIPAHNESSVIERCLESFLSDARPGEFEVCVVSNGSSDDTVRRAETALRGHEHCSVLTIEEPSKIAALRRGDDACSVYPRVYLDADITVTTDTLRALVQELAATNDPLVAAPTLLVDFKQSARAVRSYHRVWTSLPYVSDGVIGSGVYAVNAAGGDRIGEFPAVLNDDAYVRGRFARHERRRSRGHFTSRAPLSTVALIKRRARVEIGNQDIEDLVDGAGTSTTVDSLTEAVRSRSVSITDTAVYVAITFAAKIVARYRVVRGTGQQWSTDSTSRVVDGDSSETRPT